MVVIVLLRSDYGPSELAAVPLGRWDEPRRQEVDISIPRERVSEMIGAHHLCVFTVIMCDMHVDEY